VGITNTPWLFWVEILSFLRITVPIHLGVTFRS